MADPEAFVSNIIGMVKSGEASTRACVINFFRCSNAA